MSGIIKKPVQRRIRNYKDFFHFRFLQGVIEVYIFVNIRLFLFTFSVIFAKIWHNFANIIQNKLKFLTAECCFYR